MFMVSEKDLKIVLRKEMVNGQCSIVIEGSTLTKGKGYKLMGIIHFTCYVKGITFSM